MAYQKSHNPKDPTAISKSGSFSINDIIHGFIGVGEPSILYNGSPGKGGSFMTDNSCDMEGQVQELDSNGNITKIKFLRNLGTTQNIISLSTGSLITLSNLEFYDLEK